MPYRIREAHESDVPALAALHVQTFTDAHRSGRPGGRRMSCASGSGVSDY